VPALGMMWLAAFTVSWLDWGIAWLQPVGNWNGAFWLNSRSHFGQFNSFAVPATVSWFGAITIWLCLVLRWVRRRWPDIGVAGLLAVALGFPVLLDFVLESALIRLGLYAYGGSVPALTLFPGHYYSLPIWQPLLLGPVMGLAASLVYFVNDRGQTVTERGIDRVYVSDRAKAWLRFLALSGGINMLVVVYSVTWGLFTLNPNYQWSKDVVNRSYIRGSICGQGTSVACPAAGLPVSRGAHGLIVAPSGDLKFHGEIVGHIGLTYK
jgi:hypothetical protein